MELTNDPIYYYNEFGMVGPLGSIIEKDAHIYAKNSCKKCNGRGVCQWSFKTPELGGIVYNLACNCVVNKYKKTAKELSSIV